MESSSKGHDDSFTGRVHLPSSSYLFNFLLDVLQLLLPLLHLHVKVVHHLRPLLPPAAAAMLQPTLQINGCHDADWSISGGPSSPFFFSPTSSPYPVSLLCHCQVARRRWRDGGRGPIDRRPANTDKFGEKSGLIHIDRLTFCSLFNIHFRFDHFTPKKVPLVFRLIFFPRVRAEVTH